METLVTTREEAKSFMVDCFMASGTNPANAEIAAANLVEADYRGHYSHGMNRLHFYIYDILCGKCIPNAEPAIERETAATALVNGNNGLGLVIGKFAMDLAIKKAKDVGIGMVAVHNTNHFGIAGMYTIQAIEQNCIGISCTNTSPCLVPTRSKEPCFGTNPISFGAPSTGNDSLVLDMATSTVALGKVELYNRMQKPLPSTWALNKEGRPESDSSIALEAKMLQPLGGGEESGGYKGYALSFMVEVLCGILSGSKYGPNINHWIGGDNTTPIANLGHCFIAIDPKKFAPGYKERMGDLIGIVRSLTPEDPNLPVLIPGDPERLHMKKVDEQGGFFYVKNQHETNEKLAKELKIKPITSMKKIL